MNAALAAVDSTGNAGLRQDRCLEIVVEIGGMPITLRTGDAAFARMVIERYAEFARTRRATEDLSGILFDIELIELPLRAIEQDFDCAAAHDEDADDDLEVTQERGVWRIARGDFSARWNSHTGRGTIRQTANPYSLDSVLRIVHSLLLARRGEFLAHAASAIRNGRAFLFAGVSGAGKTTISRLAPPDVTLLTDEISYVRKSDTAAERTPSYVAYGTPFAGELARIGTNCSAPLSTLYLLRQGPENRIDEVPATVAVEALLRNTLFFARDPELVSRVFSGACEFVNRVPVRQLTFRKDASVWELIG